MKLLTHAVLALLTATNFASKPITNISSPLANFGSPPVGACINMHGTQVGSPGTVLAKYGAMRFDDIATNGSLSSLTSLWAYSKAANFNNLQILNVAAWGVNSAGHARDMVLASTNGPDWIEVGNEVDYNNAVDHTTYNTYVKAIANATRVGNGRTRLCGPALSRYDANGITYVNNLISDGTLDYFQAFTLHGYPLTNSDAPELIATYIRAIRALLDANGYKNMPIFISEIGANTGYTETYLGLGAGGWTASNAASLYARFVSSALSAGATAVFLYDGPASINLDGYPSRTNVTANGTGTKNVTVGSTTGLAGKTLYFATQGIQDTVSLIVNGTQMTMANNCNPVSGEGVYICDQNEDITDNTNKTTMGTALDGLLPIGGVGNASIFDRIWLGLNLIHA